jgi:hypothetical protein
MSGTVTSATVTTTPVPPVTVTGTPPRIREWHGFIAVRYDCKFVADSPQQKWATMRAETGLSNKPKEWQRCDAAQLAGAGYAALNRSWKQSISHIPRVMAAVSDRRVTGWLTGADVRPKFDLDKAVAGSPHELAGVMSTADGSAWGSCTIHPDKPLPPQHKDRPDDTRDWPPPPPS